MQLSRGSNAGFSTAAPDELYLPIDPSDSRPDVATEEKDPASMLNFTRTLLKLRREHPALANTADFEPMYAETTPFVYLRTHVRRNNSFCVSACSGFGAHHRFDQSQRPALHRCVEEGD